MWPQFGPGGVGQTQTQRRQPTGLVGAIAGLNPANAGKPIYSQPSVNDIINPGLLVDAFVKDLNALINADVKLFGGWLGANLPLAIIAVVLLAVMLLAANSFIKD